MPARQLMFLAKPCDEMRQTLRVRRRQEGAILITLTVTCSEMRKILFKKGKEYRGGARLQKQRIRKDVVGPGFRSRADECFEI